MRRAATILSSRIEDPSKRCPCPSPQQFEAVAYCRCRIIQIAALPNGVRPDLRDRKGRLLADHVRLEAGELSANLLAALSTVEHIDDPLLVLRPQRLLQPVRVCHHSTLARRGRRSNGHDLYRSAPGHLLGQMRERVAEGSGIGRNVRIRLIRHGYRPIFAE
jgi:hypothetical protein